MEHSKTTSPVTSPGYVYLNIHVLFLGDQGCLGSRRLHGYLLTVGAGGNRTLGSSASISLSPIPRTPLGPSAFPARLLPAPCSRRRRSEVLPNNSFRE